MGRLAGRLRFPVAPNTDDGTKPVNQEPGFAKQTNPWKGSIPFDWARSGDTAPYPLRVTSGGRGRRPACPFQARQPTYCQPDRYSAQRPISGNSRRVALSSLAVDDLNPIHSRNSSARPRTAPPPDPAQARHGFYPATQRNGHLELQRQFRGPRRSAPEDHRGRASPA